MPSTTRKRTPRSQRMPKVEEKPWLLPNANLFDAGVWKSASLTSKKDHSYCRLALYQLARDFRWVRKSVLTDLFVRCANSYILSWRALRNILRKNDCASNVTSRSHVKSMLHHGRPLQVHGQLAPLCGGGRNRSFTVELLRNRRANRESVARKHDRLRAEVRFLRMHGRKTDEQVLMELQSSPSSCESCKVELSSTDCVACTAGHKICRNCVQNYARKAAYGCSESAKLVCLRVLVDKNCPAEFETDELAKVLSQKLMDRLKTRRALEVEAAEPPVEKKELDSNNAADNSTESINWSDVSTAAPPRARTTRRTSRRKCARR